MNSKAFVFGFCLFGLGLALGAIAPRSNALPGSWLQAKDKLQALASSDLEEYYRLKTMEEKYRKADEILGKIMQIFLADLGLHLSGQAQRAAQMPLPAAPERAVGSGAALTATPLSPVPAAAPVENKKAELPLPAEEALLLGTRDESDVPNLLKKLQIQNFDEARKLSTTFSNRENILLSINGHFEGRASVSFSGESHLWYLQVEIAGAMQKEQLRGGLKIRMSENGKLFSNSDSSGILDSFREFAGDSKALLAEASPTEFFQIYYLKDLDQLAVNIYRRSNRDSGFSFIGSSTLKRSR